MAIEQAVVERLRALPPDKQREVLDFVEELQHRTAPPRARRSLRGLWADLVAEVTDEDLAAARLEMWGDFPRGGL